jgi:predicted extracellular nuclease/endonuclease I
MKLRYPALLALMCAPMAHANDIVITGVVDGSLSGGLPKAIEIFVINDIADLATCGVGAANNGGGTDGQEVTFNAGPATAGTYIYVASESTQFTNFFGFSPDYTSSAASINGDDAIELFCGGTVVDVFGDINVDGNGEAWEYLDGWAARVADTGPDGSNFQIASWTFSGINALDGVATNASAGNPFPIKSYADEVGGGGGDTGGGGGDDDNVCTNCPDVAKVADASTFVDDEYYAPVISEVDAATGITAIKGALTSVISANFNSLSYTEAWTVLTESDQDPANTDNVILLYSGKSIPKSENASGTFANEDDFWNREHVWPNSHGFADDGDRNLPPVLEAFSDVHHLRPTDRSINASRGNLDFDESDGPLAEAPANSIDSDSFEPRDEVKGDVARMMLYRDTRYEGIDDVTPDLMLVDAVTSAGEPLLGKLCTLLAWHAADPVSEFEQNRNNVLYEYQGNRNPYVDHPEWVELLYPAASCGDDNGGGGDNGGGDDGGDTGSLELIITGVIDGPLPGGLPKAIEIYVASGSDDLSVCGVGSANNGGGSDGEEFTLSGSAETGDFIYVASEATQFEAFFGFAPDFTNNAANVNGDDAIELFCNNEVVDVFGDINTDGTGEPWEHLDGWAYRSDFTGPDGGSFELGSWTFSGPNALDGETDNATAETPFPIGTYTSAEVLIITGVIDGPLPGGLPKAVEFYAATAIADLGVYGFGSANNGGGSDGQEYTFSGSASKGDYIYIASEMPNFNTFFGFNPDDTNNAANINGDDAIELFKNGEVVDVFGDINTDGTGEPWEHLDGWAYRVTDTGPDGDIFVLENWMFSGPNALDGEASNASAETPFPLASFSGSGNGGGGGDDPDPVDFGVCLDPATFIHEVQGSGSLSPLDGNEVIIEGVVTADYQADGLLNGFFIQEEDVDADADLASSEGIFVSHTVNDVSVGDVVRLQGTVEEFFDLTQITAVSGLSVCSTGASVTMASLTLPISSLDEYEQVEGMLVAFSQPLVVTEHFNLDRFGQMTLSSERTYQFTHNNAPDVAGYAAHLANLPLNQIILDDAKTSQNPDPSVYLNKPTPAENAIRGGSIADISGVMSYAFGNYVIQPVGEIVFTDVNPRTVEPEDVGGNFKVAGINVLNYFTTLDENGAVCGPSSLGCRGAEDAEEFARQKAKTVAALSIIDADILGLVELENNASESLSDLVNGLNEVAGAGTYAFVNTGTIGGDAIKVGFIYKPASATPVGTHAILDSSVDPLFIDTKNRPALAQTFTTTNGETMTVAVNHFKSKGSGCEDVGDAALNDGAGNCAGTRANAATALVNWLATDPTASGDEDFLILGDLNAYAMEAAITNITDAGFTNLISAFGGSNAYSYVFGGELGYLDHALASTSLTEKVTDVTEWHINSDEPDAFDYNTNFKSDTQIAEWFAPDAYRMSDHDPVIIGFDFQTANVAGDYDGDGDLDMFDLRAIMRAIRTGEALDSEYDADGNGRVDIRDVRALYSQCTRARCAVN